MTKPWEKFVAQVSDALDSFAMSRKLKGEVSQVAEGWITYYPTSEMPLIEACTEATGIATVTMEEVRFVFNGVTIRANPNGDPQFLADTCMRAAPLVNPGVRGVEFTKPQAAKKKLKPTSGRKFDFDL